MIKIDDVREINDDDVREINDDVREINGDGDVREITMMMMSER